MLNSVFLFAQFNPILRDQKTPVMLLNGGSHAIKLGLEKKKTDFREMEHLNET